MDDKEYDVEVVFRQRAVYRVRAPDRETAEAEAAERWREAEPGDVAGYEWSELEAVHVTEAPSAARREEDAQLVLRFLRERERLIVRLGGASGTPSGNDAIAASQVASDLGWSRRDGDGRSLPDVPRATRALEHLCQTKRVVCFERPRVRAGERGEIRLYCTPEYLDHLSESLHGRRAQAV